MKGVGANSIFCLSSWKWVYKWYSSIKTSLRNCEDFICNTCSTTTGAVNSFPTCITINVDRPTSHGSSNLRWKDVVNTDLLKKHLNISLARDRSKHRNAIRPSGLSNGLVVKALDSQSRGPVFKTSRWLQGRLSPSSF